MATQKNTGIPYELLTQAVFQEIHDQELVRTISVKRNVRLRGKTTEHQIDVYWEFIQGGVTYRTIVQAKDWNKPVDQSELLAFKEVLDDLPGQPRGIFVTKKGYQAGAKQVASANGIILYELDEVSGGHKINATTLSWIAVDVKLIQFEHSSDTPNEPATAETALGRQYTVYEPEFSNFTYFIDKSWVDEHIGQQKGKRSLIKMLPRIRFNLVEFYDQNHSQISKLDDLLRDDIAAMRQEKIFEKHIARTFEEPTYLGQPPLVRPDFVKVNGYSVDIHIVVTQKTQFRYSLSKFVQIVLHQIDSTNTETFFRPRESPVSSSAIPTPSLQRVSKLSELKSRQTNDSRTENE